MATDQVLIDREDIRPSGVEPDWIVTTEWPGKLQADIEELNNLERIYTLMQADGPASNLVYMAGMNFLREARKTLRIEIAAQILGLHEIGTDSEPSA